jgi:glutamyl-tRNA reductase
MEILVSGASHREAPVGLRERLARGGLEPRLLLELMTAGIVKEGLVISTCNRLEIVAVAEDPERAALELRSLMAGAAGLDPFELAGSVHEFRGLKAVGHLFRVASGLDSQVLGEAQILGQVKEAYRQAARFRTVGPMVSKLFHKSFQTAKRVRSETGLASGTVSAASAAVETAERIIGPLRGLTALILGAGEMAAAAAGHLVARGVGPLLVLSRSQAAADELAGRHGGEGLAWGELASALERADLLVAAVAADRPVVTLKAVAGRARGAAPRRLLIMDLGLPRNVEPEVGALEGVELRNMDDFESLTAGGRDVRRREAERAEVVVAEEVAKFGRWLESLSASPTIKDLIRLAEGARAVEVERTVARNGFSPEQIEALEAMSRSLVRRLLHNPLAFVKGSQRHCPSDHSLDLFRRVFGLDP